MGNEINPPRAGPQALGYAVPLAVGAYTDIIAIYGPAEAAPGDIVTIQVDVKNLATYAIYIAVTGRYDGVDVTFSPEYASVGAGATYSFTVSFTMPSKNITLDVWSFYWTGTEWYQDDHEAVSISVAAVTPQFQGFSIAQYNKV